MSADEAIPATCAYGECTLLPSYVVEPLGKWAKMGLKYACREHARQMAAAYATFRDGKTTPGAEVYALPPPKKRTVAERRERAPKRKRTVAERRAEATPAPPADAAPVPQPDPQPTSPPAPQSP